MLVKGDILLFENDTCPVYSGTPGPNQMSYRLADSGSSGPGEDGASSLLSQRQEGQGLDLHIVLWLQEVSGTEGQENLK